MERQTRIILACLGVSSFMIGTDFTGALMLVTPVEQEFGADITTTQWVLNAYALTFAMGMVTGGRLADMFGRRKILLIGLAIFLVASLACSAAPSVGWLIAARAAQGIGAALVWPSHFALASTSVPAEKQGEAVGIIIGCVTLGNVLGPVIGGVVAAIGEWRLFYVANFVLALLAMVATRAFIAADEGTRKEDEAIDYAGIGVLSVAIFALLYALDIGADWGWTSAAVLGLFAVSVFLFIVFPALEKRVEDPLVPPPMLRNTQFVYALSLNGLQIGAVFLLFLYVPQYLNKAMGWSVMHATFGVIPLMVSLAVMSFSAGRLYAPMGPRRIMAVGYGLALVGAVVMTQLTPQWGYGGLVVVMILIGLGAGMSVSAAGTVAVAAADPTRAGMAGGLSFMVHLMLGAICVAGGTAIMFAAGGGHAGASAEEKEAFTVGMNRAYWMISAVTLLGFIISLRLDNSKLVNVDAET